jgi:hypothetical protein
MNTIESKKQINKRHESPHYRAQTLFWAAQRAARKSKLPFDLDMKWIEEKLITGKCEVSDIPFTFSSLQTGKGGFPSQNPFAPTLDRTDSNKGFTKINTKVVLWAYHAGKGIASHETFLQLCRALVRKDK